MLLSRIGRFLTMFGLQNELIDSGKRVRKEVAIIKIDLKRAYMTVDRKIIDYKSGRFDFGNRGQRWIKECISSTSFSVLVNGSPSLLFKASRGLR